MQITEVQPNGIYKLTGKHEAGFRYIQVVKVNERRNSIEAVPGQYSGGVFIRRSYQLNGRTLRTVTLASEQVANFIAMGETKMANKDAEQNTGQAELTYVPEGAEGVETTDESGTSHKQPQTAEEKIAAIEEAKQKEIAAIKEKEKAKEKAATERRVKKLKDAADKAGVKEAEAAPQYSDGRAKSFAAMTDEETTAALTGLAQAAKAKKDADRVVNKNEKRLKAQAEILKAKEADLAGEFTEGRVKKFADMTADEGTKAIEALGDRVKDAKKALALAERTELTDEEAAELKQLEKTVEKNLTSFQTAAFQIGGALTAISQKRLYRKTHSTFELYVMERFGLSRPHAYSVMSAAATFQALTENETVDAKSLPSITAASAITSGVKGLLKAANLEADPEIDAITRAMARKVYEVAVATAPVDKDGKPVLSPAHLESVFSVLGDVAKSGTVELDGKAIPVNIAAASFDEMVTNESAERVARMKQALADRIAATEVSIREGNRATGAGAATNGASATPAGTGNGVTIPAGITPKLTAICSVHGKVAIDGTSDNDIKLACNCVFVATPEGYVFDETSRQAAATA